MEQTHGTNAIYNKPSSTYRMNSAVRKCW
jgi:hypothetical protein